MCKILFESIQGVRFHRGELKLYFPVDFGCRRRNSSALLRVCHYVTPGAFYAQCRKMYCFYHL